MKIIWFEEAWEDYVYWQSQDRKTVMMIDRVCITDCYLCCWSRKILR